MLVTKNTLARALVLGSMMQTVMSHTWLETIRRISSDGVFVGEPGYPRGYHARNEPGFNDDAMVHRILQVNDNTKLCKETQQPGAYNAKYPRLTAAPGEHVALQYLENGHTTTPQVPVGRPFKGGIVSVYATTENIKNLAYNDVHGAWNADGTGGDKKGRLIATRYFDDGVCYENRGDNSIPIYAQRKAKAKVDSVMCQTDIVIPKDFKTGETMHLAWVWEWPLNVNQDNQSNETYTTCAEIKLGSAAGNASGGTKGKNAKVDSNPSRPYTNRAIPEQMSSQFMVFAFGTGTAAPASATGFPTTSSKGSPTTSSKVFPTTSSKDKTPDIKTVTVTADATTVTDFVTVTVGAGNGGKNNDQLASTSSSSSSVPATVAASASSSASASPSASASSSAFASSAASAIVSASASASVSVSATTASTLRTSIRASSSAPTSLVPVTSVEKFLKARATGQARRMA